MAYSDNNYQERNRKVRYELVEHIGVLNKKTTGWTREVNIVAWNDNAPKVDIREWDPHHERMSRGVTLLEEEAELLAKMLARRYGLYYSGRGQERNYPSARTNRDHIEGRGFAEAAGASAADAAEAAAGQPSGFGSAPAATGAAPLSTEEQAAPAPAPEIASGMPAPEAAANVAEDTSLLT